MSEVPAVGPAPLTMSAGRTHGAHWQARRSERLAHICIAPAVILMVITTLAPVGAVLALSLTDYQLGALSFNWVGLDNFASALQDRGAQRAVSNTLLFAAMVVPVSVGMGLFFALLVVSRTRTRRFYELMIFLPLTTTMAAMAIVWSFVLHGRIGPVNGLMAAIGLPTIDFFSDPGAVLPSLALIGVWQHMCFCFIVFLAGLMAIPKDLYEAAALDGADCGWEKFRRITWPLLGPTTLVVVLLTTIRAFQVFDLVVVLTQGGPAGRSEVILYEMYLEAFAYFRVGYGSTLALIFIAMVGTISLLQLWYARRRRAA